MSFDLSPEIAVESNILRGFHSDPADQIIAATSRILGLPLVTSDNQMLAHQELDTIW
jgi:PIN domain nuclease of toxin-antitoxin system